MGGGSSSRANSAPESPKPENKPATNSAAAGLSSSNVAEKSPQTSNFDAQKAPIVQAAPPSALNTPSQKLAPPKDPEQVLSQWLTDELEPIFHASLSGNHDRVLTSLADELRDEKRELAASDLDSVFMQILTEMGPPPSFSIPIVYLFHVYQKSFQLKRVLPKKDPLYESKIGILNEIISLSCSYSLICFQMDDMFVNNDIKASVLFFVASDDMSAFLVDIVNKSVEQETLTDLMNIIFPTLAAELYTVNLNDSRYSQFLSVIETLVAIKPVAAIFSQLDGFQPPDPTQPLDFEHKTLLGSMYRLSPLIESTSSYYFAETVEHGLNAQLSAGYESLQNEYKVVSDRLYFITDKLIRGSPETRNALLKWFATLINLSHLRRGSHADLSKLPTDGLMFNISFMLIKLCGPFLDYPTYSKIDKIDMDFFGKSSLVDVSEESRINSSLLEAKEYAKEHSGETNFISDCFFLTLAYFHYGVGGIYLHYDRLKNQIKQLSQRVELISNNRVPPGTNPMMAHLYRNQLPTLQKSLNKMKASKHAIQAIFGFRSLQLELFDFVIGTTTFFTRVVDPSHLFPKSKLKIPLYSIARVSELDDHEFLQTKTPTPWKYYPEYILEGVVNYCKFVTNFRNPPLFQNDEKLNSFVEFAVILLRCPELVGNPHMKAHLVEVLFVGTLPMMDGRPGFISNIYNTNELVRENILYALLDFYVMVEKTGASSQFYDKFNSRYYISVILEELWEHGTYREQLNNYSKHNVEFFIRFIARMLNDTTYLLDETFNELNQIHKYQQELKKRQAGAEPDTDSFGNDEELNGNLESAERKAKSYMGLTNKTMELFKLFTKLVPRGFVLPEIVDRLASMLNYNLAMLVGPKCSNLKVQDPQKYEFDPRKTLGDLCEIYNNLATQNEFLVAVARDGRSFDISYFNKAAQILSTKTYTDPKTIQTFQEFAAKAAKQKELDEDEELELGEVPDEFLDPLMFTLMEDPVILPGSKISIDRSTIKAHLLSDPTDPFNRMPLKLEDVKEDVELKQKIHDFKMQKKQERRQENEDVTMAE